MDFFSVSLDKAFLISVKMKEQFKSVFYINMGLALQWCYNSQWVLIHWKCCNLSLLFARWKVWLLSKVNKQHKCCKTGYALFLSSIFKVMGLFKSLNLNMTNKILALETPIITWIVSSDIRQLKLPISHVHYRSEV